MSSLAIDTTLIVTQDRDSVRASTVEKKHVNLVADSTEAGNQNEAGGNNDTQAQQYCSFQGLHDNDTELKLLAIILMLPLLVPNSDKPLTSNPKSLPAKSATASKTVSTSSSKSPKSKSSAGSRSKFATHSKDESKPKFEPKSKSKLKNNSKPAFKSSSGSPAKSTGPSKPKSKAKFKPSAAYQCQALRKMKHFKLSTSNRTKRDTVPSANRFVDRSPMKKSPKNPTKPVAPRFSTDNRKLPRPIRQAVPLVDRVIDRSPMKKSPKKPTKSIKNHFKTEKRAAVRRRLNLDWSDIHCTLGCLEI
ncbi:hypothetical protein AAMO2058_000443500 [Amorphochlora amoebiformis]|eukprot:909461-Amorphochlora_amoeboformis.AAC.1